MARDDVQLVGEVLSAAGWPNVGEVVGRALEKRDERIQELETETARLRAGLEAANALIGESADEKKALDDALVVAEERVRFLQMENARLYTDIERRNSDNAALRKKIEELG